jgi:hypothetical protein
MSELLGMKWDVKAIAAGLVLLGVGAMALSVAHVAQVSPDSPPTLIRNALNWLALLGIIAVLAGSLAIAAASISFCGRWAPRKLAKAGVAFLATAAVMSGVGKAFPPHTYAWVPVLMPWCAAIFAGTIMLLGAMIRGIRWPKTKSFHEKAG